MRAAKSLRIRRAPKTEKSKQFPDEISGVEAEMILDDFRQSLTAANRLPNSRLRSSSTVETMVAMRQLAI